jgi:hypothetical protein
LEEDTTIIVRNRMLALIDAHLLHSLRLQVWSCSELRAQKTSGVPHTHWFGFEIMVHTFWCPGTEIGKYSEEFSEFQSNFNLNQVLCEF